MYTYDTQKNLSPFLTSILKTLNVFALTITSKATNSTTTLLLMVKPNVKATLTLQDTSLYLYDFPKDCQDWFDDQWFEFRRNDIQLPSETGKNIAPQRPCYCHRPLL